MRSTFLAPEVLLYPRTMLWRWERRADHPRTPLQGLSITNCLPPLPFYFSQRGPFVVAFVTDCIHLEGCQRPVWGHECFRMLHFVVGENETGVTTPTALDWFREWGLQRFSSMGAITQYLRPQRFAPSGFMLNCGLTDCNLIGTRNGVLPSARRAQLQTQGGV